MINLRYFDYHKDLDLLRDGICMEGVLNASIVKCFCSNVILDNLIL